MLFISKSIYKGLAYCFSTVTLNKPNLPKTGISVIGLTASFHCFQFIFLEAVTGIIEFFPQKILPVPCLEVPILPPLLKISPNPSEDYIICFLRYWQLWHTDSLSEHSDLFPSLLLPADESQEHDFAAHIIKFLSLQARRSSNSSVMIWSFSLLAMLSSFVSHANFLRLGLMVIPNSWKWMLNSIAPKTDPWGTPSDNVLHSYNSFFIMTCCSLFTWHLY